MSQKSQFHTVLSVNHNGQNSAIKLLPANVNFVTTTNIAPMKDENSTNNDIENRRKEIIESIKTDLMECIDDGVKFYKAKMDSLLLPKHPFKESQLMEYHSKTFNTVTMSLHKAYDDYLKKLSNVQTIVQVKKLIRIATTRLETLINAQLNDIYMRKYEIQMAGVVKMVKGFTDKAEILYDENAEKFDFEGKNWQQIIDAHNEWKKEAFELFNKYLKDNKLDDIRTIWESELTVKINERLDELQEEFEELKKEFDAKVRIHQESLPSERQSADLKPLFSTVSAFATARKISVQRAREKQTELSISKPKNPAKVFFTLPPMIKYAAESGSPHATMTDKKKNLDHDRSKTSTQIIKQESATNNSLSLPGKAAPGPGTTDSCKVTVQPQLDICSQSEKVNATVATISPQMKTATKTIDIGIYIDGRIIKIGRWIPENAKSTSNSFVEIESSPHLYFSDDYILVGPDAFKYRNFNDFRYFNIFDLITSPKSTPPNHIVINNQEMTLCCHEIITAYFNTLLRAVEAEYNVKIGKIVVTSPFTPTSAAKERIRQSAFAARYPVNRILSTLITTPFANLENLDNFTKKGEEQNFTTLKNRDSFRKKREEQNATTLTSRDSFKKKREEQNATRILILHYQKHGFSIGLVEMKPIFVSLKKSYGSDYMVECDDKFSSLHKAMYEGRPLSPVDHERITQVYNKAISHILCETPKQPTPTMGLIVSDIQCKLVNELIIKEVKGETYLYNASLGPLMGASRLASILSTNAASVEPFVLISPDIRVEDPTRCCLKLTVDGQGTASYDMMNTQFKDGVVFPKKYRLKIHRNSNMSTTINFQLKEEFGNEKSTFVACSYSLTLINDSMDGETASLTSMEEVEAIFRCHIDADGVLSLKAVESGIQTDLGLFRTDNLTCSCGNLVSDYLKLVRLYYGKEWSTE